MSSEPTFSAIPDGVNQEQLTVNGIRSCYWECGDGKPLVLVHGGGPGADGISNWYRCLPLFAERGFRTIAVNLLGFGVGDYPSPGKADYPKAGFSYSKEARRQHLLAQLDSLDLGTVRLMGNSIGGSTALGVAMVAPERIDSLVLMGSLGATIEANPLIARGLAYTPDLERMRTIVRGLNGNLPVPDEDDLVRYRYEVSRLSDESFTATMAVAEDSSAPGGVDVNRISSWTDDQLARVTVRTLVVNGREDTVTSPEYGLKLHRLLPSSMFVTVPGAGHWVMMPHAEAYADLCTRFFMRKSGFV